jgi:hypothetical protein
MKEYSSWAVSTIFRVLRKKGIEQLPASGNDETNPKGRKTLPGWGHHWNAR